MSVQVFTLMTDQSSTIEDLRLSIGYILPDQACCDRPSLLALD